MKRSGFGLRTTIVVNISLVMLITMLLIGFVVITIAKKTIYDNKVETAETILRSLQHQILSSLDVSPDKHKSLYKIVEEYTGMHGLEGIVLVDSSLNALVPTDYKTSGNTIPKGYLQKVINSGKMPWIELGKSTI